MLPDIFGALANPARRTILDELRNGPRTAGDLTGLLEQAAPQRRNTSPCSARPDSSGKSGAGGTGCTTFRPAGLAKVGGWLKHYEHYWNQRLDALGELTGRGEPFMTDNTIRLTRHFPHPRSSVEGAHDSGAARPLVGAR